MTQQNHIRAFQRDQTLFAGIRKPIHKRQELVPRVEQVTIVCRDVQNGPLTHIFRFDTPVDGFDSEVGYPVKRSIQAGEVNTHTLRRLHFFSMLHQGPVDSLRETTHKVMEHLRTAGLSPELELMELYHRYDPDTPGDNLIETCVSYLAWPEIYLEQLQRVLGPKIAAEIWQGGESITPFTPVDERAEWVGKSISRLKSMTSQDQQFDILSRVALDRPIEDILPYKDLYSQNGDVNEILAVQNSKLAETATGGFVDPPWYDGKVLHLSKVPYNREAYDRARSPDEIRRAYCFCALVREASSPEIDPIFCYRAAGWARQFWEPILGVRFTRCEITHSILKGDKFCAWNYVL
jgi:hypothetical protein